MDQISVIPELKYRTVGRVSVFNAECYRYGSKVSITPSRLTESTESCMEPERDQWCVVKVLVGYKLPI